MNGILLVDKPSGWTSNDVVAKLKGVLHERRIGHSGTLDPMATGLLVVFVGRATRAVEFAESHSKEYIAGLRLGLVTDTQDTTGTVLSETPVEVSDERLAETLVRFTGEIDQLPPMYSAIKVNGQRLYAIARRGGDVERQARRITIERLTLLQRTGADCQLSVACSKGTYIRTLCHDIGAALGCGGCMSSLRRVRAGTFRVEDAHTLDEIIAAAGENRAESLLLPADTLFAEYPACTVNAFEEQKIRTGGICHTRIKDGTYRAYSGSGEFLALLTVTDREMKTTKSFFEVPECRK